MTGPHRPRDYQGPTGPFPPSRRPTRGYDPAYEEGYGDEYYEDREPPRWGMVVGVSVLVSAITVVTLYLVMDAVSSGGTVTVPAMVGQSVAQARITAENSNLTFVVAGKTHDPVIKVGHVALQSPLAGTNASSGTMVAVTLSKGPSQVTLPSLKGISLSQALERLKALGLELGETSYQPDPVVSVGHIITTNPGPGAAVIPGTLVKLVVARGGASSSVAPRAPAPAPASPAPAAGNRVKVPRVRGVRLRFARPRLRSSGLTVGRISYQEDEDHMEEMVLKQTPNPGAQVPRGSSVDLVVNRFGE